MNPRPSTSENNGIAFLSDVDQKIYSVGISTGGSAELRMVMGHPNRHVIATTIDPVGAEFAKHHIDETGFSKQIEVKIEDVTKPLAYPGGFFDYVYARLVLHYLNRSDLKHALLELHRMLKAGGKLFVVVRSTECAEAQDESAVYDADTGLTTYHSDGKVFSRYFHSEDSIKNHLVSAGFSVKHIRSYREQLCIDFQRQIPSKQVDALIEILATK